MGVPLSTPTGLNVGKSGNTRELERFSFQTPAGLIDEEVLEECDPEIVNTGNNLIKDELWSTRALNYRDN